MRNDTFLREGNLLESEFSESTREASGGSPGPTLIMSIHEGWEAVWDFPLVVLALEVAVELFFAAVILEGEEKPGNVLRLSVADSGGKVT